MKRRHFLAAAAAAPALFAGPQDADELVVVRREVPRINLNPIGKTADARAIGRQHGGDEPLGGGFDQGEIFPHAAAAIQEHHDRDGLQLAGEEVLGCFRPGSSGASDGSVRDVALKVFESGKLLPKKRVAIAFRRSSGRSCPWRPNEAVSRRSTTCALLPTDELLREPSSGRSN